MFLHALLVRDIKFLNKYVENGEELHINISRILFFLSCNCSNRKTEKGAREREMQGNREAFGSYAFEFFWYQGHLDNCVKPTDPFFFHI